MGILMERPVHQPCRGSLMQLFFVVHFNDFSCNSRQLCFHSAFCPWRWSPELHQIISVIISRVHPGRITHPCDGQRRCFSAATVPPVALVYNLKPFRLQSPHLRFVEKSDRKPGGTPWRIMRVEWQRGEPEEGAQKCASYRSDMFSRANKKWLSISTLFVFITKPTGDGHECKFANLSRLISW